MKKTTVTLLAACTFCMAVLTTMPVAAQTISYNANVNAINGVGNASTGWSTYTDTGNNFSIDLMSEWNYPSYPGSPGTPANQSDGAGTYGSFTPGPKPGSLTKATWNYWFGVNVDPNNTGSRTLANSGLTFMVSLEAPGGSTFSTPVNILTAYSDNSYGNNSTLPDHGIIAGTGLGTGLSSTDLQGMYNIGMNSQNIAFMGGDINLQGLWTEKVDVFDASAAKIGTFEVNTLVGVAPVPEPSTWALAGIGGVGLLVLIKRNKNRKFGPSKASASAI